jgi:hypothetical protein
MKKLLCLIALAGISFSSHSQVLLSLIFGDKLNSDGLEFGLDGGVNFSNISDLDSANNIAPFNLGFYFDIRVKEQWSIYTGVLVKAELGVNKLTQNDLEFLQARIFEEPGTYSQRIRYFLVPALMKYSFDNNIFLEGGPMFGLRHKAWIEYRTDADGFESVIKQNNKDAINAMEVGAAFGVGYRFKNKGWGVGLRIYHGLTNVYKDRSGTHNRALFLRANVPIGAGKAKKKKEQQKDSSS